MPQVVKLQVAVTQAGCAVVATRRDIVIHPERKRLAQAARADDRKRIWREHIRAGQESECDRLLAVVHKVAGITERHRHAAGNFPRIDRLWESFLLRFGAEQYRRLLHE